jgi:hypothetical protein
MDYSLLLFDFGSFSHLLNYFSYTPYVSIIIIIIIIINYTADKNAGS